MADDRVEGDRRHGRGEPQTTSATAAIEPKTRGILRNIGRTGGCVVFREGTKLGKGYSAEKNLLAASSQAFLASP